MNITDLIVEFVKEGNVVEFPGMGTLTSSTVSAYHDAASGTYYPARRTVVMTAAQSGNQAIVRRIAESECVTVEIAEMMWKNYVGALNDKLQRDPNGHEFSGIGIMRREGGKVIFAAREGLDLDADKRREQPLENVSTYTPKNVQDPFAAFEKTAEPTPAPSSEPALEEPAPERGPEESAPAPEPIKPAAEPAPNKVQEPAPEPTIESVPATEASASAKHLSEVKRMLDEIPASPKTAKEARRAEKAAAKAEKEARKASEKAEKESARKAALLAKEKEADAKEAEKALRQRQAQAATNTTAPATTEGGDKKKKRGWLWVVILLLLVLAGGAVYFLMGRGAKTAGGSYAKEVQWSRYDDADMMPLGTIDTNMLNLLEFDEDRIAGTVDDVHAYMAEYIHNFLLARHYSNAFAPMMNSLDQYASGRLHELMVPGISSKRFHPYTDFWMEHNIDSYKAWGGRHYQYKVQGELMDVELLENMLDELVVRLGLHADGFGLANKGVAGQGKNNQYKSLVDRPFEETVPEAPTFRNSKQGYDIIAGFATDKRKANKLANQLKKLGSDAYIISKSGGYYISMGSAPTLTAAQAMEDHIKAWYQGPVSIKDFNE